MTLYDGKTLVIDSLVSKDTIVTVYNFEVEDFHNYFVGKRKVLVHNDCLPKLGVKKFDDLDLAKATGDELFLWSQAFESLYKAGKVSALTRNQAAYFVKLLRNRNVYVRIDNPHLKNPNNPWKMKHLNVGNKGVHVPIQNK